MKRDIKETKKIKIIKRKSLRKWGEIMGKERTCPCIDEGYYNKGMLTGKGGGLV